jgi:predicted transcriptional regulator
LGRRIAELTSVEEVMIEILAGSTLRGRTFAEIVRRADKRDISRATVARYLLKMIKNGLVKKELYEKNKTYYKLAKEAISTKHARRSLFSILAMHLFDDILGDASKGKLKDDEFTRLFINKIGVLAMYTLLQGFSRSNIDPIDAGKWIEDAFGTLEQKYGWRICLNRQIFGKPVPLRHEITLKHPVMPEIIIEEGTIYVKLPDAIEPGLVARLLRELPPIPKDRSEQLKASLKKLYPKETEMLDIVSHQIEEAASISTMVVNK